MSPALTVFLALFVFMMVTAMPVAWSMLLSVVAYIAVSGQWTLLPVLPEKIFQGIDVFILVAIPLFLLAGELFSEGGLAQRIVVFADAAFRWMRGGIAQVAVATCIFYAGITGVALGEIAALGRIFIPAMVRAGYTPAFAAAVIASGSIIGPTIPPSLPIIIYGSATNVSIGGMFAAAVIPGIILGAAQMAWIAYTCRRFPLRRDETKVSLRKSFMTALPSIGMPFLILGGILGGVFTPTEAGAVATLYAVLIGVFVLRTLGVRELGRSLLAGAKTSAIIYLLLGTSNVVSWILVRNQVPKVLAQWSLELTSSATVFIVVTITVLFLLGLALEAVPIMIMLIPVLAPAAVAYRIDPHHLGLIIVMTVQTALLSPPVALSLYVVATIVGAPMAAANREVWKFMAVVLAVTLVTALWPAMPLAIPRLFGF